MCTFHSILGYDSMSSHCSHHNQGKRTVTKERSGNGELSRPTCGYLGNSVVIKSGRRCQDSDCCLWVCNFQSQVKECFAMCDPRRWGDMVRYGEECLRGSIIKLTRTLCAVDFGCVHHNIGPYYAIIARKC